ncbi:hypothetical protein C1I63_11100 [Rathayibacter caricis DSM 15933]|uniref:Glycosyltransferase RgtA/B/C/D-like domain-containing protein n=1 Tax=Rathayibacter caricis DSM 15933 TaxID=1328867 RepID=A0A2T4UUY2_9MICO|nr:hypothetical protein [Rathayibacter caricis]PTL73342.1 hypothetical protein C1I63_11100 [Rathayibacter caricis DSM 15933]
MTTRELSSSTATGRRRPRADTLVFWTLAVAGLVLRILFLLSPGHVFDTDHATVFLMARHVAEGEIPAFFWGQSYGGTLLPITAGAAMVVLGSHVEVLAVVSVLWFLGAAILLRHIVARAGGALAGTTAGLLFWFPGVVILTVSTRDPGFYGPSLVTALGLIAIATAPLTRPYLSWIGAGLLGGLALWSSPMSLALAAPAALWLVLRDIRHPLRPVIGVCAALVAGAPWIVEALRSEGATESLGGGTWKPTFQSVVSLFDSMLPAAFGDAADRTFSAGVGWAAAVLLVVPLIAGLIVRKAGLVLVSVGSVLVVTVLVYGAGLDLAPDSVRYSAFLAPGLAASLGWLVSRWRPLAVAAVIGAVAFTSIGVWDRSDRFTIDTSARFDPALRPVAELLGARGEDHVYGNYWLSATLTASTDEEITVAPLVNRRYPPYEDLAASEDAPVIVVDTGRFNDVELDTSTVLPPRERVELGRYTVYFFSDGFDVFDQPWGLF